MMNVTDGIVDINKHSLQLVIRNAVRYQAPDAVKVALLQAAEDPS